MTGMGTPTGVGTDGPKGRTTWPDVLDGLRGAAAMVRELLRPGRREERCRWGVQDDELRRAHPGDDLVPTPRWSWTHAIAVAAPAERVWPWVAQVGADRAGFYSYSWLENLVGCGVRNADTVHPEWELRAGDELVLHPTARLPVTSVDRGRSLVAYAGPDAATHASGRPWVAGSWAFEVVPVDAGRSRVLSRYRADSSDHLRSRLTFGPTLVEPVGFVMDRRMLEGIRARAEGRPGRLRKGTTAPAVTGRAPGT